MFDSFDFAALYQPFHDDPRCAACGEPASPCARGGYWLYEGRRWHPACVDWARRPLPFRWALDAGRRHIAWLRRERAPVPEALARAVTFLAHVSAAWPVADPAPTLELCQKAADIVEHHRIAGKSTRERRAGYPLACVWPPGVGESPRRKP
jgi:hypothetical protein